MEVLIHHDIEQKGGINVRNGARVRDILISIPSIHIFMMQDYNYSFGVIVIIIQFCLFVYCDLCIDHQDYDIETRWVLCVFWL